MKNKFKIFGTILVSTIILASCGGDNKKDNVTTEKEINNDSLAYLYGKWKYEELGIAMNLKINSDKTFSWDSDYGSFNGTWSYENNSITFTPDDELNEQFVLLKNSEGSLEEQTADDVKPIYNKVD
jgi:hypothetical protein